MIKNAKRTSAQLALYFILGGAMTLLEWAMFWVLVYLCEVHYLVANVALFAFFVPFGMWLFKKAIFKSTKFGLRAELFRSFLINLFGLGVNSLILWLLVEFAHFDELFSKILASFLVAFYSFFARKIFIYGR